MTCGRSFKKARTHLAVPDADCAARTQPDDQYISKVRKNGLQKLVEEAGFEPGLTIDSFNLFSAYGTTAGRKNN